MSNQGATKSVAQLEGQDDCDSEANLPLDGLQSALGYLPNKMLPICNVKLQPWFSASSKYWKAPFLRDLFPVPVFLLCAVHLHTELITKSVSESWSSHVQQILI